MAADTSPLPTLDASAPVEAEAGDASTEDAAADGVDAWVVREAGPGSFGTYRGEAAIAGIERNGDLIRVFYIRDPGLGGFNKPVELTGHTKPNGAFHAAAFGKVVVDGSIDAVGHLTGTFKFMDEEKTLDLQQQSPFDPTYDAKFTARYLGGVVGDVHVRTTWTRDHDKLSGTTNNIRGEKHTLDGTLDGKWGTFQVTEKDAGGTVSGRWTGVFLSTGDLIARWASPDGTTTRPITLDSSTTLWDYPPAVSLLGGGTITPGESYFKGAFYSSSAVAPSFAGLPVAAAETSLNAWSRKMAASTKAPDSIAMVSAWDETAYSVVAQRAGWVALDVHSYSYAMGGTHGFSSTMCRVVDLDSGRIVSLVSELSQAGRTALGALTRQTISKDPSRPKNEGLNYVTIDDKRPACVIEEKGALLLDVIFGEDDGFYVMAPVVHIPASAVRPLFPPGSIGAKVFQP